VFYKILNYAAIHALPVLYLCENNLYSTESPLHVRQPAGTDLCERVRAFKIPAERVDGNDVLAVFQGAERGLAELRAGQGPVFLECMTYRWLEHVGPNFDHEVGRTYRTEAEVRSWMEQCPVKRSAGALIAEGIATEARLARLDADTLAETEAAARRARAAPLPDAARLFDNTW